MKNLMSKLKQEAKRFVKEKNTAEKNGKLSIEKTIQIQSSDLPSGDPGGGTRRVIKKSKKKQKRSA